MIYHTDIVIIGGGIAGLWTLNRLKQQGYSVILLENAELGSGQTIKSQGIIHGGLKYALSGNLNANTAALRDMPNYWASCLLGTSDIDLSAVKILSMSQYMWSVNRLTGGISSLFASAALRSHVQSVPKEQWPLAIRNSAIKSKLYKLSELVLDVPSLITALATPYIQDCIKIDKLTIDFDKNHAQNNIKQLYVEINKQPIKIQAQKYIFTAGSGNQIIAADTMQLRPLQMVLVKSNNLPPLFGHCISLGTTPRITITTHIADDNIPVWYLGGKIAEDGINLDSAELITLAKQELTALFPKLDLSDATWASFFVDRAEYKQANGSKPNGATVFDKNNYITAWPTKLALSPVLTEEILNILQQQNITPRVSTAEHKLPAPQIAKPIWDKIL